MTSLSSPCDRGRSQRQPGPPHHRHHRRGPRCRPGAWTGQQRPQGVDSPPEVMGQWEPCPRRARQGQGHPTPRNLRLRLPQALTPRRSCPVEARGLVGTGHLEGLRGATLATTASGAKLGDGRGAGPWMLATAPSAASSVSVSCCASASSLPLINQLWGPPECQPRAGCWDHRPCPQKALVLGTGQGREREESGSWCRGQGGQREANLSGPKATVPRRVRGRRVCFVPCPAGQRGAPSGGAAEGAGLSLGDPPAAGTGESAGGLAPAPTPAPLGGREET